MESQQQVPPGIVALAHKTLQPSPTRFTEHPDYDIWVTNSFRQNYFVHTISVDGKEWSVNGWIEDKEFGDVIISRLEYDFDEKRWIGYSGESWYDLNHLSKAITPSSLDRPVSQPGRLTWDHWNDDKKADALRDEQLESNKIHQKLYEDWVKRVSPNLDMAYGFKEGLETLEAALKSRPSEGWSDTQLKDFAEYCDNHEGSMENLFKQWKNKWL